MTVRGKVLSLGLGMAALPVLALTILMLWSHLRTQFNDVVVGSQGFARVLAQELVADLASGRIDRLDRRLSQMASHDAGMMNIRSVGLLDHDGRVLAHSDPTQYGAIMADAFIAESARKDELSMEEVRLSDQHYLRIVQPVITAIEGHAGLRWGTLILEVSLERVRIQGIRLVLRALVFVLPALTVLLLLGHQALTRQLIRPLHNITDTARAFATGDLTARARVSEGDELAELGSTMNDMAQRLQRHTSELEGRIRDRTVELERVNQGLNDALSRLREANEALATQATTDGLTGLRNFRFFQQQLRTELLRSRRLNNPVSLLMIDVDNFKLYNDRNGHPAGDQILIEVSAIIRRRLRATDVSCRYGGEEFAVLLLDTPKRAAASVAGELRSLVEDFAFPDRERQPSGRLTISIGVATFPDDAKDAQSLLKGADDALYRAKALGRNRVEQAEPSPPIIVER